MVRIPILQKMLKTEQRDLMLKMKGVGEVVIDNPQIIQAILKTSIKELEDVVGRTE